MKSLSRGIAALLVLGAHAAAHAHRTSNQPIAARRPFGARPVKPLLVEVGVKWEL